MIQDTLESPEESNKMIRQPGEGLMKIIRGSQCNPEKPQEGKNGRISSQSPGEKEDRSFGAGGQKGIIKTDRMNSPPSSQSKQKFPNGFF